ncbi:hypothetical protein MLD38_033467 [Melastoma candidum]|uniref:Uncharacterized protein n=1 Tax=Melastoma candidum TaxID=119954 RepID=A0ACB9M701_9MYRT|nr:hypothetical protein MLD38_033467 [Melastoma candidum]
MEPGKQGAVLTRLLPPNNPIEQLQSKFKEVEVGFKDWLSKQSLPVEAAVVTATSAFQGAAIGGIMGTLTNDMSSTLTPPPQATLNPQAMASLKQAQALSGGPLVQARNFAVMTGVNAGISCVMKRLRGKEDVESSMVAAFGSGAMFSLVSGFGGPNQVANAVSSGLFFALVQGGIFKLGQKFSQPPAEDTYYSRTRSMLSSLGLQNYEKNFKKGLLTDSTLPLLTDRQVVWVALRDVKIPPGPRLLILDHIQRLEFGLLVRDITRKGANGGTSSLTLHYLDSINKINCMQLRAIVDIASTDGTPPKEDGVALGLGRGGAASWQPTLFAPRRQRKASIEILVSSAVLTRYLRACSKASASSYPSQEQSCSSVTRSLAQTLSIVFFNYVPQLSSLGSRPRPMMIILIIRTQFSSWSSPTTNSISSFPCFLHFFISINSLYQALAIFLGFAGSSSLL